MANYFEKIQKVPLISGKTFIVGDLHGHFDLLEDGLRRVNFNTSSDRLICLGDLVDRGPRSVAALAYLDEPWFYAVRGNHEDAFVQCHDDRGRVNERGLNWHIANNGGGWWRELSDEQRWDALDAFNALPLVIEVDTPHGPVGLLHAEVPIAYDNWDVFLRSLDRPDAHEGVLWGRSRIKLTWKNTVFGVRRVYCGHTIVNEPTQLGNHYFIDTGAFGLHYGIERSRLTIINLDSHLAGLQPQNDGRFFLLK